MRYPTRAAVTAAAILTILSCAGGPELTSRRVPDWVLTPPAADAEFEYFVVSAWAAESSAEAEEAAGYVLLSQINQALGVEISVETSAEARSTLDSYEANLVQQVTQRGSGQIEGLRVADRFIAEQADGVVVYLLGEYERTAFEAERAKRRSILRQQEELVTGPENEGDRLVESGRLTQGILLYGQAAVAASGSDLRIAPIVLQRALQKAAEAGSRIELSTLRGPAIVALGVEIDEPIIFLLRDDRGRPVAGASVEISYVDRRGNRDVVRTAAMLSNDAGLVAFRHPAPQRVGEFTVTARLDLQPLLSMLDSLPRSVDAETDAVEDAVVNVRATHRFVVLSQAREIPTAVVVLDLDAAGLFMPGDLAGGGIVEALSQSGFQLRSVPMEPRRLFGLTATEAVAFLQERINADVARVIFGSARIAEFREDDGFLVKVSGSVTAVDLASGAVLYRASGIKNARSRTADRAISTAFAELGRQLGEELASNLP
ncbi:MAG: hypothetical protein V3S41_00280 [Spirochaetia bacterium]